MLDDQPCFPCIHDHQALWNAYVSDILAAQSTSCASCDAWLASLHSAPPLSSMRASGAVESESVTFTVPEGFGPSDELYVVVDGVLSPNASFTYDAPVITNVAPDREVAGPCRFLVACAPFPHRLHPLLPPGLNLTTLGTLNVWIDGSSLCASTACGYVLFNGGPPLSTPLWSHRQIEDRRHGP